MTATYQPYPTLSAFLDATKDGTGAPRHVSQMAVEAYILNLLLRWQLEDENGDAKMLEDTNSELGELRKEMTDDEVGAVMSQFVAWIRNGDGWLADYITRTAPLA
jgi:hypothetical protein